MKYILLSTLMSLLFLMSCGSKKTTEFDITTEEAKEIMTSNAGIIVIDVRTPEETAEGTIGSPMTINVKGDDFKEKIAKLDRDAEYLVYCRTGNRSGQACMIMKEMGFTSLKNMQGGYREWTSKFK